MAEQESCRKWTAQILSEDRCTMTWMTCIICIRSHMLVALHFDLWRILGLFDLQFSFSCEPSHNELGSARSLFTRWLWTHCPRRQMCSNRPAMCTPRHPNRCKICELIDKHQDIDIFGYAHSQGSELMAPTVQPVVGCPEVFVKLCQTCEEDRRPDATFCSAPDPHQFPQAWNRLVKEANLMYSHSSTGGFGCGMKWEMLLPFVCIPCVQISVLTTFCILAERSSRSTKMM